ncbi:MAG: CotH kinase family protein [Bacilli bacterium]|nr:CotH kinase family protein [Bacilli bacterium]
MKNAFKKLVLATIPFLLLGCSEPVDNPEDNKNDPANNEGNNNEGNNNEGNNNQTPHTHSWKTEWEKDANNHWHACEGCNEKNDSAAHDWNEWETKNLGELLSNDRYNFNNIKLRTCKVCGYEELDKDQKVLPEIRFTFDANDANADFATKARSTDKTRPTVSGKIAITNAGSMNTEEGKELDATMKVRGNQTAGFDKKGLQIKFDKKQAMFGLNGGKKFKKWVLLADAKDTTISRTALGLTMSKGVIAEDSKVWATDFTPVSVYLNDKYWGMYMLAEQKEVKEGRIKLDEPIETYIDDNGKEKERPIMTTDIGYCFEMDYYAKDEPAKGADGDPTFTLDYGNYFTRNSFNIESCLANSGLGVVNTYTMNSDINDGPEDAAVNASNSNQVKFIRDKLQALFTVLAEASKNKVAKDIDSNNQVTSTSMSVKQAIEKHFDLNAWAEGFIINAVCLPPDVGYSSFYMSFDNTENGDKKLRYDNPWDFDSNFGNRRGFIEKPNEKNGNYDPYFMDRTANMWFQFLGKLDFFINDYVKPKWNTAKTNKVFENMLGMLDVYYKYFDGEYTRNFAKWTTTQASDSNVSSYFNGDGETRGELRKPFVNVNERKQAQQETINWLTKRVSYLDTKWGNK